MGLDGMLDYGQAKTTAAGIARPILMNTVKALKNVRLIAKWHTWAIVMHSNDRFATVTMGFNHHIDAGLPPMLKRIINQIVNHLLNAKGIRFHPRQILRDVDFYLCRDLANPGWRY